MKKRPISGILLAAPTALITVLTAYCLSSCTCGGATVVAKNCGVSVSSDGRQVALQNELVRVSFDLTSGCYRISTLDDSAPCIDKACARVGDRQTTVAERRAYLTANDTAGMSLTVENHQTDGSVVLLKFSLQRRSPALVLSAGLRNGGRDTPVIKRFSPLADGLLFAGCNLNDNLRLLDGAGGALPTAVHRRLPVATINNLMLTFGKGAARRTLVAGGVAYSDFNKYVGVDSTLCLYADDPVGKRLSPGEEYLPDGDRFYIDCATRDPFVALETYGRSLARLQNARPNYYTFPTICLWYAMKPQFGNFGATNDSPGAVAEMQHVKASGWLRYTTAGIRLVPDCYDKNNENGWWDDAHWQQHGSGSVQSDIPLSSGHLRAPCETTAKWAGAVSALGGIPFIYFQTAVRSDDYAEQYPEQMLFNEAHHRIDPNAIPDGITDSEWGWAWGYLNHYQTSYDFTDTAFQAHLHDVYRNLRDGGVRGLMYDYPNTGWAFYGGMDDRSSTAGAMYRKIFATARRVLGDDCWLHERNLVIGSDITLGLVASQRIWGDTDLATPEMFARGGLRWYKNRVAVCYDMDAKNLLKATPDNADGLRKMLTMTYATASRLLLANSFKSLSAQHLATLSRVFPYHSSPLTARPVDLLINDRPTVYSFRIDDDWQQVVFYNDSDSLTATLTAALSSPAVEGGLELRADRRYYVYDFWNDAFVGALNGDEHLTQTLRAGEARMLSVRAVAGRPQILSTDRHLLQGYVELADVVWDEAAQTLRGKANLVADEAMKITVAPNSYRFIDASAPCTVTTRQSGKGLLELVLAGAKGGWTEWEMSFAKPAVRLKKER
jgi:hypothetical protein